MTDQTTYMPGEWSPHSCTWMAWPSAGYTLGTSKAAAQRAYRAWADVANAIINFEPVKLLANENDIELARKYLDPRVEVIQCPLDDGWMRDIGPTFVKTNTGEVRAVDWQFNGWGAQDNWASWTNDNQVAKYVATIAGVPLLSSWLVNEGGGIHVNGAGKVLATETVQLGNGRNPNKTKLEVETEINRLLGTSEVIWFKRGLTRDYQDFGTLGHVDIVATFVSEDTVLFHDQQNPEHPDFEVSQEVKNTIQSAGLIAKAIPAPTILKDEDGWVDYSYVNHYLVNGGVVLCSFDDENDKIAAEILGNCYPDRRVVMVDARELFTRGGGIHCITQQQPA